MKHSITILYATVSDGNIARWGQPTSMMNSDEGARVETKYYDNMIQ